MCNMHMAGGYAWPFEACTRPLGDTIDCAQWAKGLGGDTIRRMHCVCTRLEVDIIGAEQNA